MGAVTRPQLGTQTFQMVFYRYLAQAMGTGNFLIRMSCQQPVHTHPVLCPCQNSGNMGAMPVQINPAIRGTLPVTAGMNTAGKFRMPTINARIHNPDTDIAPAIACPKGSRGRNLLQARLGGIFTACPAKLHLATPATSAAANTARKGK